VGVISCHSKSNEQIDFQRVPLDDDTFETGDLERRPAPENPDIIDIPDPGEIVFELPDERLQFDFDDQELNQFLGQARVGLRNEDEMAIANLDNGNIFIGGNLRNLGGDVIMARVGNDNDDANDRNIMDAFPDDAIPNICEDDEAEDVVCINEVIRFFDNINFEIVQGDEDNQRIFLIPQELLDRGDNADADVAGEGDAPPEPEPIDEAKAVRKIRVNLQFDVIRSNPATRETLIIEFADKENPDLDLKGSQGWNYPIEITPNLGRLRDVVATFGSIEFPNRPVSIDELDYVRVRYAEGGRSSRIELKRVSAAFHNELLRPSSISHFTKEDEYADITIYKDVFVIFARDWIPAIGENQIPISSLRTHANIVETPLLKMITDTSDQRNMGAGDANDTAATDQNVTLKITNNGRLGRVFVGPAWMQWTIHEELTYAPVNPFELGAHDEIYLCAARDAIPDNFPGCTTDFDDDDDGAISYPYMFSGGIEIIHNVCGDRFKLDNIRLEIWIPELSKFVKIAERNLAETNFILVGCGDVERGEGDRFLFYPPYVVGAYNE